MSLARKYFPKDDFLCAPVIEVIVEISPKDLMFDGNLGHYFSVGFSAMRCIKIAMHATQLTEFGSILDMPCGYGRVLRILKAYFPRAVLTACDLDRDAVDFCRNTFNAIPLYSERNPKDVVINDHFDLIWVGSLFSHLDYSEWDGFLETFFSLLNPNGLLVITTRGRRPAEWIRKGTSRYGMTAKQLYGLTDDQSERLLSAYDADGFGYVDYQYQNDYGVSLASPSWVLSHTQKFADLRLVTYLEYGWDHHQDVVAFIKTGRDTPHIQ